MKALGLNQVYILLKLQNNYYIVLIRSFEFITGNILELKKKFFSLFGLHGWFSIDTEIDMDTENDFKNNKILQIFIYILGDFLDLISSK